MKSIFKQIGGTYTLQGDYRLPNLTLPAEEKRPIGVWGQRRLRYLEHNHKILYYNLLTSVKLHSHLADTEEQAQALFFRLVNQLTEKEGNFRPVWSSWVVEGLFGGYYAYFFAPEKHLKYRLFPNSKLTIYLFLSRQFTIDFLYENRI